MPDDEDLEVTDKNFTRSTGFSDLETVRFTEPVDEVRIVRITDFENGLTWDKATWESTSADFHKPHPDGDAIEFRARAVCPLTEEAKCNLTLWCNGEIIAEGIRVTSRYRFFHFLTKSTEPVWDVQLCFATPPHPDSANGAIWNAGGENSESSSASKPREMVHVDPDFGLRVRGVDILLGSHMVEREEGVVCRPSLLHQACRNGHFEKNHEYRCETSVEFVARGLSGREVIDIFVNGLSVPLQMGVALGKGEKVFRYQLAPISCHIHNVIVRLTDSSPRKEGSDFGVMIDPRYGFLVGGQNCIATAVCMHPTGGRGDEAQTEAIQPQLGKWITTGCYLLLPYRRTRKVTDPAQMRFITAEEHANNDSHILEDEGPRPSIQSSCPVHNLWNVMRSGDDVESSL
mmetsp:Transcript_79969/g.175453  ORF Transcript_79969/g.175453 Transcript_79969/m.175453 type:complete len:402 (+) Transcript_79969:1-1206(+)